VSGFYFETLPQDRPSRDTISLGPRTGLIDNLTAQYWGTKALDDKVMMDEARAERDQAIERATGKSAQEALDAYVGPNEQPQEPGRVYSDGSRIPVSSDTLAERLKADLAANNQGQDILTGDALKARALEIAQDRLAKASDTAQTGLGWNATIGRFLGEAAGQLTDPLTIMTLPFGGTGSLLETFGSQVAIGAAQSFGSQYASRDWRKQLGQDTSAGSMAREAVFDGLIQGATAGAIHLGARGIEKILSPRDRIAAFDKQFPAGPPPGMEGNRDAAEAVAQLVEDNPLPEASPTREPDHIANTLAADSALAEDRPVELPRPQPEADRPGGEIAAGSPAGPPPGYVRFFHGGDYPTSVGGRWVTTDPVYAKNFRAEGRPNNVSYVDIPIGDPTEIKARAWDDQLDAGTNMVGRYHNIEIPEKWAKQFQPYRPEAGSGGQIAPRPPEPLPGSQGPPLAPPGPDYFAKLGPKMRRELGRAPAKPKAPESLIPFLARHGGIKDSGGELKSMDLDKWFRAWRSARAQEWRHEPRSGARTCRRGRLSDRSRKTDRRRFGERDQRPSARAARGSLRQPAIFPAR
jgi:hypothetical protein